MCRSKIKGGYAREIHEKYEKKKKKNQDVGANGTLGLAKQNRPRILERHFRYFRVFRGQNPAVAEITCL
jgi:hypothetical protein